MDDLRTPLTAISGYLELLEDDPSDENIRRYIKIISERTNALRSLTEELFSYSVIKSGPEALEREPLSLTDETEIALSAAYGLLKKRGITPVIRFPGSRIECTLDRRALQRVLGNILSNAAVYSDGDLTVEIGEDGTMRFSNTASRLSEIEVGKLFDRFCTVENAKGSTGLGLSIAKLLTERMGGEIKASYHENILTVSLLFK